MKNRKKQRSFRGLRLATAFLMAFFVSSIGVVGSSPITPSAHDIEYVYDSLNRLTEVRYGDRIIRYTYDDAGNRNGMTVEIIAIGPSLLSINPTSAAVGGSSFALNVIGGNFNSGSIVQWNGSTRPTSFVNANQLTATVSASDLETLGTATVSVLNSSPDIVSNAAFFTVESGAGCVPVSISNSLTMPMTATASIPVTVSDLSGKGIGAFDFVVSYNSAVIQPVVGNPTDTIGTLSSGSTLTVDTSVPGQLRVGGFRLSQYAGAGTLIKLNFQAVGAIGTSSPLTFGQFRFNESDPCTTVSNGDITIAANNQISGTVSYGIVGTQGLKRVVGVNLTTTAGSPSSTTQTDINGSYLLTGLANGAYTVAGTKTGDVNGITSFDATLVLRFVAAGGGTLTSNQQIAADTNGNNSITSFDATQVLRFVAAGGPTAQTGQTGNWKLNPSSRNYASLTTSISSEDYDAMLVGEVNGNWTPPGTFADPKDTDTELVLMTEPTPAIQRSEFVSPKVKTEAAMSGVQITIPNNLTASNGSTITVPVLLTNNNTKVISGYQFAVLFNSNVLQPANPASSTTGTLSTTFNVVADTNTVGRIGIAAAGGNNTINGAGTLVNLRFNVVGTDPANTTLTFSNVLFEDDNGEAVPSTPSNGFFFVAGPTAASASISGMVRNTAGFGVKGAQLRLTSSSGRVQNAVSNAFGFYKFEDVLVGETYTISVTSKSYTFAPRVVSVTDSIDGFDFVSQ